MAQSAITVTTPNPTPPTNFGFTGSTPPNPPNYTKLSYLNYVGVGLGSGVTTPIDFPSYGSNVAPAVIVNPPPFFDDGSAGSGLTFAANIAALASGTGATSGGTENTYPGAAAGAVPASTSVAHEGAGSEILSNGFTNTVRTQNLTASVIVPVDFAMTSTGNTLPADAVGGRVISPNQTHASTLSPATNPALVSIAPTSTVSGAGTQVLTCTGTGFVPGCQIWVNGVQQATTFTNSTTISATVNKKLQAGTWPVVVKLGGLVMGATATWTFT